MKMCTLARQPPKEHCQAFMLALLLIKHETKPNKTENKVNRLNIFKEKFQLPAVT